MCLGWQFHLQTADDLSNRLIRILRDRCASLETYVAFCFEKTSFVIVSMLTIMEAGGMRAPLHPAQPYAWHQSVMKAAGITIVLTDPNLSGYAEVGYSL